MRTYVLVCVPLIAHPDYEAVGPVSLYFIAFAGFIDQFDHKNRVVKAKNPAGAKKSHKHRRYKPLRPEIPISGRF